MDLVNPIPGLEKLLELFEDGAEKGGTFVDQVLCHAAVDGLSDTILVIGQLCSRMEEAGLLERHVLPLPGALDQNVVPLSGPRTPVERRQLARLAVALDPEGRVVRLPTALAREVAR